MKRKKKYEGFRIFKAHYKDEKGKRQNSQKYYIDFRDHNEHRRKFPGLTDEECTKELGKNIVSLVACKAADKRPDKQLALWLCHIPAYLRENLIRIGLLEVEIGEQLNSLPEKLKVTLINEGRLTSQQLGIYKPLSEHLMDFERSLSAGDNTIKHVKQTMTCIRRIISGCKFLTWKDISGERVENFLSELRRTNKKFSAQTHNSHLQAMKHFCHWMQINQKASGSPVENLERLNTETDRRRNRRALETNEIRRLLQATLKAPERFGMSGYERYLLYRVAVETGLRANELRTLTVNSFDMNNLTVTVAAGYSKHRSEDVLPIKPELAKLLKEFFKTKLPGTHAFGGRYKALTDKTSNMIKEDLAATEEKDELGNVILKAIPYLDEAGRFCDFHSLRHTTGSLLAASGAHPKVAQAIMRHSDINLTMNRYTHIFRGQAAETISKLPDLSLPNIEAQEAKATGTDGEAIKPENHLSTSLVKTGGLSCVDTIQTGIVTMENNNNTRDLTTPERIRTSDLRIRNPLLYPAELRALKVLSCCNITTSYKCCQYFSS